MDVAVLRAVCKLTRRGLVDAGVKPDTRKNLVPSQVLPTAGVPVVQTIIPASGGAIRPCLHILPRHPGIDLANEPGARRPSRRALPLLRRVIKMTPDVLHRLWKIESVLRGNVSFPQKHAVALVMRKIMQAKLSLRPHERPRLR